MANADIVVIGAGLIGVTVARELASRGQGVELLEAREGPALETSYANGGMLTPSMSDPWNAPGVLRHLLASLFDRRSAMMLRLTAVPRLIPWGIRFFRNATPERYWFATRANYALASYSICVTRELREQFGLSYDASSDGTLKVFRDRGAMERGIVLAKRLAGGGLNYRVLERDALLGLEPALKPVGDRLVGGLYFPDDELGDAHLFCRALTRRLVDSGISVRTRTPVKRVVVRKSMLVGVETDKGIVKCRQVVVAGGNGSTALLRPLGVRLPIRPVKGYSVTVRAERHREYWPRFGVVDDFMHAAVVPLGERIRVVGTAEFAGNDRCIRKDRIDNLLQLFGALYPQVASEIAPDSFERWAGLRPMSADGVPFIGPTSVRGLFVSTGHGHLGWTMAAGSGRVLADMMLGALPALETVPYDPMRYSRVLRDGSRATRVPMLCAALLLSLGTALGWSTNAHAQTLPSVASATDASGSTKLQEIVITAEKRREDIQTVPISVTAISGNELQEQGITSMTEAAQEVPGVAVTTSGPGQTQFTLRGLSSSGPAVSTVGFYLDDAPMTAPTGAQNGHVVIDPDLYDLSRVEVLRGPQGTLYGAGSMGGTIKIVTNQPQLDTFSASSKLDTSGTSGGGANWGANAMLNLPILKGKLAVRLVGTDKYTSGWIDRVVLANFPLATNPEPQCAPFAGCSRGNVTAVPPSATYHGVNNEHLVGGRISVLYVPTDQLSISGEFLTQAISQNGLSYFDDPPGTEAHYQPFNVPEPFSDSFHLGNLVVKYQMPTFTVTSVSSYWSRAQYQTQDISEDFQALFDLPCFDLACGGAGPETVTEVDGSRQYSEELRLTSTSNSRLQWLIGGFYSDYDYTQLQFYVGPGILPLLGTGNLYLENATDYLKQTAGFGQLSYNFTPRLKAAVGLRKYGYTEGGPLTLSGAFAPTLAPTTTYLAAESSGLNPQFTLSYDVPHGLLLYSTISKGFRPGAGNSPVPITGVDSCLSSLEALGKTSSPTQYGPDTIWSYEVGEKANLFGDRVMLDTDAYYERWTKVQQQVELECGYGYIDNVGTADVRGGELALKARLSGSWTLSQNVGYTHAVFTSSPPGTGVVSGERLLNVPEYSAATSLVFNHALGSYTFVAQASNVLQGSQEDLSYSLKTLPGYDLVRARIGLVSDRRSVFVFADNLTNRQAFLNLTHDYFLNIPSLDRVATNQPRTIGLTLDYYYQ